MKVDRLGEIGMIKRFARKIRLDRSVVKGPGDDTAVIRWTKDKYLLLTCDMLVENTHFKLKEASARQIGRKALNRNISDIAAMGGIPRYAVISVGMAPGTPSSFADALFDGMNEAAKEFGVNIVGGDLSRSGRLVIDVSLAGEVERDRLVLRSGAKAGDLVLVTGSFGGSSRGRHLDFTPRIYEARKLVSRFKVNSMIDVSDGLLLDLWRILDASRVGARIHETLIPISKEAGGFDRAVSEGEDFELLFTMSRKEACRFFKKHLAKMKTPVTLIGEITKRSSGYRLVREDGREELVRPKGFLHF